MDQGARLRFIPTGVGNIRFSRCRQTRISVHPHGCGEHQQLIFLRRHGGGSSPRVWGTSSNIIPGNAVHRFIPTGVGNIQARWLIECRIPVHPHGCGEHTSSNPMKCYSIFKEQKSTEIFKQNFSHLQKNHFVSQRYFLRAKTKQV